MLKVGLTAIAEDIVTEVNTAKFINSGELSVFGTPYMIALMEVCASKCVKPYLEDGQGTVGTMVNVTHVSATPVGMKVHATCELLEIEGRKLVFTIKAFDEKGLIGEGTHERFIIDNERFMAKVSSKK